MLKVLVFLALFAPALIAAPFTCDKVHSAPKAADPEHLGKKPVFIYLVNDHSIAPGNDFAYRNVMSLIGKLDEAQNSTLTDADKGYLKTVRDSLVKDFEAFQYTSDQQLETLRDYGCGVRFDASFAIVSSRGSRSPLLASPTSYLQRIEIDYCLFKENGRERNFQKLDWGFSTTVMNDLSIQSTINQPLLSAAHFKHILAKIREVFPGDKYQYILWVKSTGDKDRLMRPFLEISHNQIQASKIWEVLLAKKFELTEVRPFSYSVRTLLEDSFPENRFVPKFTRAFGSKAPVLKEVQYAGTDQNIDGKPTKNGMRFPYVVFESEESDFRASRDPEIMNVLAKPNGLEALSMDNIGRLCTLNTAGKLGNAVEFSDIFTPIGVDPGTPLVDHVGKLLEAPLR